MKKLEKIKLNSAKLLNDTEMKAVFGGSGTSSLQCICPDDCPQSHRCGEGLKSVEHVRGIYIICGGAKITCESLCATHQEPHENNTL